MVKEKKLKVTEELIETLWNVNMEVRFPNGSRIMN